MRAELDPHTYALYLEVAPAGLVLLQALFESYEGVGIVRTLDSESSIVCILSTPSFIGECERILQSVAETIPHRLLPELAEAERRVLMGDFRS